MSQSSKDTNTPKWSWFIVLRGPVPGPVLIQEEDYAPTLNSTPWANGSSVPQLMVQVWRRM